MQHGHFREKVVIGILFLIFWASVTPAMTPEMMSDHHGFSGRDTPTLTFVHISSNNTDSTSAKVGNKVTIQFNASEPLNATSVSVLIDSNVANVTGDGLYWNASYVMRQADIDGIVGFAINFSDIANDPGIPVTSVTESSFVRFDKTPPVSSVDSIIPYWWSIPTTVVANADDGGLGVGVENLTLYYCFSADNITFGGWMSNGTQDRLPGSWVFQFENGTGYYRFMSIATDLLGNIETKGAFDAMCGYETSPPISNVEDIIPFWQTGSPLTITATASNGLSGVKNVTLYYRFCDDNSSWNSGWANAGLATVFPWSWSFTFPNGSGYYQFYSIAFDNAANRESAPGSADAWCGYDATAPNSSVDTIIPYWMSASTTITATANDETSGVKNVTLYYRFSGNNGSWGNWISAGVDIASPWNWGISFTNGTGHYQFHTIAKDNATNTESAPGSPDALCGYDTVAPTSSVDPISPYWKSVGPLTINASASDGLSGVKNVTLYYSYSSNNMSWGGWVSVGVDTVLPWSWNFTFPNGTKYYQFKSTANDNATNNKTGSGEAEAQCGFDIVIPPNAFIATAASTTQINLAWTKGTDANRTRIQRKTGGYPLNISDGTNVYNGSNASCADSGLSAGTLYYYRAWSFNASGSIWSTANASASATTQSDSGVGPGPGPMTEDASIPVAKPGGPYHGAVDTVIHFDGSSSYDTDTSIVRYDWRFSSSDAWHNNSGATPTHTYDVAGTFTVTLRVLDGGGNTGMNTTTAIISVEAVNQPPTAPRVTGPTIGVKNTPYIFSFVSTDSDGDSIRYHVDWGDGTMNTSSLQNSSSVYTVAHPWTANNVYTIRVYAEDQNNASSESTIISMAINSTAVQGYGFCIDTNGDSFPDSFYWNSTGQITPMERQSNGTYLLDFNGDAAWDHWYDPITNTISAYSPVLPVSLHQQNGDSWLFLAVIALVVVIIGLVVWLYRSGRI